MSSVSNHRPEVIDEINAADESFFDRPFRQDDAPAEWSSQPTPAEIDKMAAQAARETQIAPVATVTVPAAALQEYQLANARFRGFIEAVLVELQRGRDIDYRPALVEHLRAELAEINREARDWLAAKFSVEHMMPRPAA